MEQGINKDTRRLTTLIKHPEGRVRKRRESCKTFLNPNVVDPHRGKAHQSALDVAAHRRGQDEAYLTVREILSEASTVRPEPFGSELKAELLTAEGGRRWRSMVRAQRLWPVWVRNIRVALVKQQLLKKDQL